MTSAGKRQSHSKEWLFCIVLTLLLAACERQPSLVQLAGASMGTTWHVTYVAPASDVDSALIQAGIEERLQQVVLSMSTYQADSEISRFNAAPLNTWFVVSPDFYTVLSSALAIGGQSGGAYDVTVGSLVDLWGFGPTMSIQAPPAAEAIDTLLLQVGQHQLRVDAEAPGVMKLADVRLDFSSIAKGFGVDQVAELLDSQGIERYLVELGGEMRMSGLSHRGDAWHVAIEQPDSAQRSVAAAVSVTDQAVATSGDYRNYFEIDGQHYSHSIDPRSGWPVAHDLVSVTVIHPSAMIADAWATALIVLGAEEAMVVAQEQGLAVYLIRRKGSEYEHSHTPEFASFLVVEQ